jgi:hypothetical protein
MFIEKKNEDYFSVVIPTMWKSEHIHKMLEIYEKCDLVKEIIIVDNNYENKPNLSNFKKIIYYTENKNIYVNPAWNIGYTLSSCKLILANDDIIIENLTEVLSLINQNKHYDIIGISWKNTSHLELKNVDSWGITGYGCFMYVKHFISIPSEYKIWRGDFILFSRSEIKGVIFNPLLKGSLSETVESNQELKLIAKNDAKSYDKNHDKSIKKILFVLVNYGFEQLHFLKQITQEIKSFKKYESRIIVHSNVHIADQNIDEIIIFDNLNNYQLLPLTCRNSIKKNINKYDLYVYGENDHLFLEHHFDKFLEYSKIIPEDRITGLIQYEANSENNLYYPAFFKKFDWDYTTVEEYDGKKFAHFKNIHQASFIINNNQLNRISKKYDFANFFGDSPEYSVKCRVNTDIYKFCDMKKMICISDFKDNLIHHLPNVYIDGDNGRNKNQRSEHSRMVGSLLKLFSYKSKILPNNTIQNFVTTKETLPKLETQKDKITEEKVLEQENMFKKPKKTLELSQKQINYDKINAIFKKNNPILQPNKNNQTNQNSLLLNSHTLSKTQKYDRKFKNR